MIRFCQNNHDRSESVKTITRILHLKRDEPKKILQLERDWPKKITHFQRERKNLTTLKRREDPEREREEGVLDRKTRDPPLPRRLRKGGGAWLRLEGGQFVHPPAFKLVSSQTRGRSLIHPETGKIYANMEKGAHLCGKDFSKSEGNESFTFLGQHIQKRHYSPTFFRPESLNQSSARLWADALIQSIFSDLPGSGSSTQSMLNESFGRSSTQSIFTKFLGRSRTQSIVTEITEPKEISRSRGIAPCRDKGTVQPTSTSRFKWEGVQTRRLEKGREAFK
jgi:hypothetical protein